MKRKENEFLAAEDKMSGLLSAITDKINKIHAEYQEKIEAWEEVKRKAAEHISDDPARIEETVFAKQQISEAEKHCSDLRKLMREKVYAVPTKQEGEALLRAVEKAAIQRNIEYLEKALQLEREFCEISKRMTSEATNTLRLVVNWASVGAPGLEVNSNTETFVLGADDTWSTPLAYCDVDEVIYHIKMVLEGMKRSLAQYE